MPSDLTERLADAAEDRGLDIRWVPDAKFILPLLLSEPELVAGLAPEVRDDVLCVLMSLKARESIATQDKPATVCWLNALGRLPEAAMADVAALTPEGKPDA